MGVQWYTWSERQFFFFSSFKYNLLKCEQFHLKIKPSTNIFPWAHALYISVTLHCRVSDKCKRHNSYKLDSVMWFRYSLFFGG